MFTPPCLNSTNQRLFILSSVLKTYILVGKGAGVLNEIAHYKH